jgi:hypothetical protein
VTASRCGWRRWATRTSSWPPRSPRVWLPFLLIPEKLDDVWGAALRAGEEKRAPELGELQITGGGFLALEAEYFDTAEAAARQMAALYVGGMGARGKNFYNTRHAALRLSPRSSSAR